MLRVFVKVSEWMENYAIAKKPNNGAFQSMIVIHDHAYQASEAIVLVLSVDWASLSQTSIIQYVLGMICKHRLLHRIALHIQFHDFVKPKRCIFLK